MFCLWCLTSAFWSCGLDGELETKLTFGRNLWAGWASNEDLRPGTLAVIVLSLFRFGTACVGLSSFSSWIANDDDVPVFTLRLGLTPIKVLFLSAVVKSGLAVSSPHSKLPSHELSNVWVVSLFLEFLDFIGQGVPTSCNRPDMMVVVLKLSHQIALKNVINI
jgi:hypothetical protein